MSGNANDWQRKDNTMDFEDLTPEQQEKAKACKSADELVELAKAEGFELTDEELEAISGGSWLKCHGLCEKDASPYC